MGDEEQDDGEYGADLVYDTVNADGSPAAPPHVAEVLHEGYGPVNPGDTAAAVDPGDGTAF